jgi:hypothetical protein
MEVQKLQYRVVARSRPSVFRIRGSRSLRTGSARQGHALSGVRDNGQITRSNENGKRGTIPKRTENHRKHGKSPEMITERLSEQLTGKTPVARALTGMQSLISSIQGAIRKDFEHRSLCLIKTTLALLSLITTTILFIILARMNTDRTKDTTATPRERRVKGKASISSRPASQEIKKGKMVDFDTEMREPAESLSEGGSQDTPSSAQENDMSKILRMMAENLGHLGKYTQPKFASQLPPYPAESVPVFDGNNITAFLERYEEMSKYYEFTDKMKVDRLTAHCKTKQRAIIQASEEYSEALETGCWKLFREALRNRFRTHDRHQQEERAEYFEHWLLQCQKRTGLDILEYLQDFQIRSKRCIEANTIEEERRGFYLVKGLPFRQAAKVLEKFQLKTDNPKSFDYKKIRDYLKKRLETEEEARLLNPAEAVKELEQEEEFVIDQSKDAQKPPLEWKTAPSHYAKAFQPATLHIPTANEQPKSDQKQAPPGTAPTKAEVDQLVDKMMQLKLNKTSLEMEPWNFAWTPREAELMSNQIISAEIRKRADEKAVALQPYINDPIPTQTRAMSRPMPGYGPQVPGQQQFAVNGLNTKPTQPTGQQNYRSSTQGYQYNQPMNQECWMCGNSGHGKDDCEVTNKLIEQGWIHFDDRKALNWGPAQLPQGKVSGLIRGGPWDKVIISEIKRRWLKRDVDPLTTKSTFVEDAQPEIPAQTNSITVQFEPDNTGAIQIRDFEKYWDLSNLLSEDEADLNPRMVGTYQCNSSVLSATISKPTHEKKSSSSHDPSKVQKIRPKAVLKKPSQEHIPHLRSHKNRDEEYFRESRSIDQTVKFEPEKPSVDTEMKDPEPKKGWVRFSTEQPVESSDKPARKHRMVEKFTPDSQKVIQTILNTPINIPLRDLLGNMPEVRKRLFQTGFTMEEFQKLNIGSTEEQNSAEAVVATQHKEPDELEEESEILLAGVNAVFAGTLPDYVLVEADKGKVVQCYSLTAKHWTDPEISQVQQRIREEEHSEDEDPANPIPVQGQYDRPAGVEHLRRDCPKVPIDIRGGTFLALIDSGAELNTMQSDTADRAMLPVTSMPRGMKGARMVSANGSTEQFAGIIWGVPIIIGGIKIRANFFVVKSCTNPIILGNPFLTDARARIEYATSGLTHCKLISEDGQFYTKFVCARGNRIQVPAEKVLGNGEGM